MSMSVCLHRLSEVQNQDGVGGGSQSDYDDSDVEEKRGITFEVCDVTIHL